MLTDSSTPSDVSPPMLPQHISTATGESTGASDSPLGAPPQVVVDAAAHRAKQAIRARLFPERVELAPHIGRFIILRELGRGGMGVVYVAYDETLDRRVAIKLLYGLPSDDASGQDRLLREAQAMAKLNHPNIAAVYETGTHEGRVFVAMEFVQGQPLDLWLRARSRPWREVVEVFIQAGRGLHAAHCAGLVHRDFKPANVMLGIDGRVRVLDFGLARGTHVLTPDAELGSFSRMSVMMPAFAPTQPSPCGRADGLTREGTIVGTPAYMPPEQFRGEPLDARADQYALCVSLFEALYHRHPFRGDTLAELWSAVLDGPPKTPPRGPRIPAWLYRVLLRGLAPDPANRFPSLTALLTALERRPRRIFRTWLLTVFATAMVIGGIYGPEYYLQANCKTSEADLAGIWDAERKASLKSVFERSSSSVAARAWHKAEVEIDEFATQWLELSTAGCLAHQRGEKSDLLYEREKACLAKAKMALQASINQLKYIDFIDVGAVESALRPLYESLDCSDGRSLLLGTQPPTREKRLSVDVLWERYHSLSTEMTLGRGRDDSLGPHFEDLVDEARRSGYKPLLAAVLEPHAKLRWQSGAKVDACDLLQEGYHVADAVGDDMLAASYVFDLLDFCIGINGGAEVTLVWSALIRTRFARAGLSDYGAALYRPVILFEVYRAAKLEVGEIQIRKDSRAGIAEGEVRHRFGVRELYVTGHSLASENCFSALAEVEELSADGILRHAEASHAMSILLLLAAIVHADCGNVENARLFLARFDFLVGASEWGSMGGVLQSVADFERARIERSPTQAVKASGQILDWCRSDSRCSTDEEWLSETLLRHAEASLVAGDPQQAASLANRAVDVHTSGWGDESTKLAAPLTVLGEAELSRDPSAAARHLERAHELRQNSDPRYRARTTFALAKALHGTHADSFRVRALGEQALAEFGIGGARYASEYAEVKAWLMSL